MKKAKDFENLWFRYKTEGEPRYISINQFCMQNGVQYSQFNKWFRNTRQDVIPVIIDGVPEEPVQEELPTEAVTEQSEPRNDRSNEIMVIFNGDVFIFMSRDRRKIKLIHYEDHAYFLHEKTFTSGYKYMLIDYTDDGRRVYKLEWKELVALLQSPVIESMKISA